MNNPNNPILGPSEHNPPGQEELRQNLKQLYNEVRIVEQFEKEYPVMAEEFKKIQKEQYELFAKKNMAYGPGNIALGSKLETEDERKDSVKGVFIRCFDKINRLKQLVFLNKENPLKNESIEDTWRDLSIYSIIAQIVTNEKWK